MRILAACSLGGSGHLNPLLPLLGAAMRAGHEVLVVAPATLRERVEEASLPFHAGAEPDEEEVAFIRDRLPVAPRAEATILGNRELFGRLATKAMLPAVEDAFAGWSPQFVLREPCEYASAVVAGARRIPTAQVAISLARGEWASTEIAAPALEEHRRGLVEELLAAPYLTRFPASLDPSPFAATIRFSEPPPDAVAPLPDWWAGSTAPLVYVSFGSVAGYMSIADDVYRAAITAVGALEARVLMTVGRRYDIAGLGDLPPHVHVEAWVEQTDVLPHADLVVCHGGSGTVFGTLAAGVPLVVVPLFADNFSNGRLVGDSGAGLVVTNDRELDSGERRAIGKGDASLVTTAIEEVLGDPSYRRRAELIAGELAGQSSVDDVVAMLPMLATARHV